MSFIYKSRVGYENAKYSKKAATTWKLTSHILNDFHAFWGKPLLKQSQFTVLPDYKFSSSRPTTQEVKF